MNSADLLVDGFGRIRRNVHGVVEGLSQQQLAFRIDGESNSIAWLIWHLTRVQDDHLADAAGTEQVWTSQAWTDRFKLPFHSSATGYGQDSDEVAAAGAAAGEVLIGYHDAVHEQTVRYVAGLTDEDLDRIVDTAWDPPVSLGVRLVSVVSDDLQHVGQAAFLRGVVQRRG
jgi:uncharacterized damage-inducible protein DinB